MNTVHARNLTLLALPQVFLPSCQPSVSIDIIDNRQCRMGSQCLETFKTLPLSFRHLRLCLTRTSSTAAGGRKDDDDSSPKETTRMMPGFLGENAQMRPSHFHRLTVCLCNPTTTIKITRFTSSILLGVTRRGAPQTSTGSRCVISTSSVLSSTHCSGLSNTLWLAQTRPSHFTRLTVFDIVTLHYMLPDTPEGMIS